MKRFIVLLLIVVSVPVLSYGQAMPVFDLALMAMIEGTWIEEAAYYVQMVANIVEQGKRIKEQAEHTVKSYEAVMRNYASVGDIKSWDDFTDWHNRQLYLEKQTEEAFWRMNVSVGSKSYSLFDIDGMAKGFDETYVKYWDREFTEEQRREMWLGLGLTSANYAYVQTWKNKEDDILRQWVSGSPVQNMQYMDSMNNVNRIKTALADDTGADGEGLTEKELLAMQIELSAETVKALNDLNMSIALQNEFTAAEKRLGNAPASSPFMSEWPDDAWGYSNTVER